jgi:hypothetical protein
MGYSKSDFAIEFFGAFVTVFFFVFVLPWVGFFFDLW